MARTVNGVSTILAGARLICRMVGRFGVGPLEAAFGSELADAVTALVVACEALRAADDQVGQIDQTVPLGPEDTTPGS
jgi:hypothetical protein